MARFMDRAGSAALTVRIGRESLRPNAMSEEPIVYLNHAGTSWPKPSCVMQATAWADQASPDGWPEIFDESRRTVADFFHVPDNRLLLTPSCTAALNVALMDLPWRPGDRLLTSPFEHQALFRNVQKLAELGVDVTILESSEQQLIDLNRLEAHFRRGGVRLLALTAACNVTGRRLPFQQAAEMARQFGVTVLLDGAQVAGWEPLDLQSLNIDLFTFAGHKGLMSPKGIGGLYVAPHVHMNCLSARCDPGTAVAQPRMPDYCDVGSVNLTALCGLAAGCRWLDEPEQKDRLQRARQLAAALADGIRNLPGAVLHHDVAAESKMPTVAFHITGYPISRIADEFRRQRILASFGFQCAPQVHQVLKTDSSGVIRCSFGFENSADDVIRALTCLKDATRSGTPK